MDNKRSLYQCYFPKVRDRRICCAKGYRLGEADDGTLPVTKLRHGHPLEISVCQTCEDYLEMGEPIKAGERGGW